MDARRRLDAVLQTVAVKHGISASHIFLRQASGQFAQKRHEPFLRSFVRQDKQGSRELNYKEKLIRKIDWGEL